jgi:hypothetical protein
LIFRTLDFIIRRSNLTFRQRRFGKSRDDIAAGRRMLKPIELFGADDDNGVFAA